MQQQMRQEQMRDQVDERLLFHGTNADAAHPICKNGFDWRLCGVHGTSYGQGRSFNFCLSLLKRDIVSRNFNT